MAAEEEKKTEEDGEKKAKATHAGWNNNHVEMKTTLRKAECRMSFVNRSDKETLFNMLGASRVSFAAPTPALP